MENLSLSYIAGGNIKRCDQLWKTVWQFLNKLNICLLYNPAIAVLGIYSRKSYSSTPEGR